MQTYTDTRHNSVMCSVVDSVYVHISVPSPPNPISKDCEFLQPQSAHFSYSLHYKSLCSACLAHGFYLNMFIEMVDVIGRNEKCRTKRHVKEMMILTVNTVYLLWVGYHFKYSTYFILI